MMDFGTSGAYYISLPADIIMVHPTTITGSVGVIFLQPKVSGLMDKIGLGVDVKKFGRYKDMGSPFRNATEEEKKLMQKSVDNFGERFLTSGTKTSSSGKTIIGQSCHGTSISGR